MTGGKPQHLDLDSIDAGISAAQLTALANQARIAETKEILARAMKTIDKLQQSRQ